MSQMDADVRAHMAHTMPGETVRSVCPFCEAVHEKSFAMTRGTEKPHLIMFRCFRGTCDANGYVVDKQGASMVLSSEDIQPSIGELVEHGYCTAKFLEDIGDKYNLSLDYLRKQGVRYGEGHALCMPWRDEYGRQIGWVEKRFDKAWYKSHHDLVDYSAGRLAFPLIARSYRAIPAHVVCILVESLVDAYCLNEYAAVAGQDTCAVALLGADISGQDALRLANLFTRIMVLLDPDQWPKGTQRVIRRFDGMPVTVHGTTLSVDPKDAHDSALEAVFERCREISCTKI